MKYGDFLLILLGIIFILSVGYSIGVDNKILVYHSSPSSWFYIPFLSNKN